MNINIPMPKALADDMKERGHAPPTFCVPLDVVRALIDCATDLGNRHQIDPYTLALSVAASAGYIVLAEEHEDRRHLLTSVGICAAGAHEMFDDCSGGADLRAVKTTSH